MAGPRRRCSSASGPGGGLKVEGTRPLGRWPRPAPGISATVSQEEGAAQPKAGLCPQLLLQTPFSGREGPGPRPSRANKQPSPPGGLRSQQHPLCTQTLQTEEGAEGKEGLGPVSHTFPAGSHSLSLRQAWRRGCPTSSSRPFSQIRSSVKSLLMAAVVVVFNWERKHRGHRRDG